MRPRFRFVGRVGDRYVWERPIWGGVGIDQITCSVEWFWSKP